MDSNNITIIPNVKYKQVIQKVAVANLLADASCDFTDAGTVALTERILEPKELQVNKNLCKQEFLNTWESVQLGYSAFETIPANFTDYLISYMGGKVAEAIEQSIWMGSGTTNGQFGGFINAFVADSDVVKVTGATITSANVFSALEAVEAQIPAALYGSEDLVMYVSPAVMKAYQSFLSTSGGTGVFTAVGVKEYNFKGIPMLLTPGLTGSYVVAAQKSNLFFGTGLLSDQNEVKVLDMADIDGSQNFRIVMRFTAGVQYGIGTEIVVYKA